jgi:hypothetical protein
MTQVLVDSNFIQINENNSTMVDGCIFGFLIVDKASIYHPCDNRQYN